MARISARQYMEWMAFDLTYGLGDMYEKEMMAQLNELVQVNNQLTGAAITKKGKKNPAGKYRNAPRPWMLEDEVDPAWDDDDIEYEEELNEAQKRARFEAEVFGPSKEPTAPSAVAPAEDGE